MSLFSLWEDTLLILNVTRPPTRKCLNTGHCVRIRAAQRATVCLLLSGSTVVLWEEPWTWSEDWVQGPALTLSSCGHLVAQTLQSLLPHLWNKVSVTIPKGHLRWYL